MASCCYAFLQHFLYNREMSDQQVQVQACLRIFHQRLSHVSSNHRRALLAGKAQPSACIGFSVAIHSEHIILIRYR